MAATVAPIPYPSSSMNVTQETRPCGGCHNPVEVDAGGVVVAFGNSLWHVDCFKCAKCGNRVSADTNLLLLSDGSPVCASCTYNCAVCKNPISDEAIMTGDESYHSACFTCKTCSRHIGELVFAKTTQGIYCMACHNERVARSRRHAEQRRNRSKSRRDGAHRDRDKDRLREKSSNQDLANQRLRGNGATTPDAHSPPNTPGFTGPEIANPDSVISYSAKRISTQSIAATLHSSGHLANKPSRQGLPLPPINSSPTSGQAPVALPSPTITTTQALPQTSSATHPAEPSPPLGGRGNTLPLPTESDSSLGPRRKSFDDGVRPLNGLLLPESVSSLGRTPSTSRTTRANKRSSINPAVYLDWAANKPIVDSQMQHSPTSLFPPGERSSNEQLQRPVRQSSDSESRSPSPFSPTQRKDSPGSRSPTTESFYSPPSSPSFMDTSHYRSQTEKLNVQAGDPPAMMKHSLSDGARPPLHHQTSAHSQLSSSGRASPALHLYGSPNGRASPFSQQQSLTPKRELPKLPVEAEKARETIDVSVEDEDQEEEKVARSVPLALPPISFTENDTSFQDLLTLGSRQSIVPSALNEKAGESTTVRPGAYMRDETHGAGPLNVSMASAAQSPPPAKSSPPARSSPPAARLPSPTPSPLNTLPKRNASLSRNMSARKPVPKAIVLPDSIEADMTFDMDSSSNAPSSPASFGRSDGPNKAKRPGSAGVGATGTRPLSPRSKPRRSSDQQLVESPRFNPTATPTRSTSNPVVTLTDTGSARTARPAVERQDTSELVAKRIKEALADAHESGASTVKLDREFLEVIYLAVQAGRDKLQDMRGKFDGMRRASQQFIEGLSVAQVEYDNELAARRDAEAEVTRLKVQLSGQAARLTELSAGDRKREVVEQMSRDMSVNLHGLERDLSKVKAERDLILAEVEELAASKKSGTDGNLQRSLTFRFDNLKSQYKRELEPLLQQRETILREIQELKEERNLCLEETTALNARNEELAELNAQAIHQIGSGANSGIPSWSSMPSPLGSQAQYQTPSTPKNAPLPPVPQTSLYSGSTLSVATSQEERDEPKSTPNERKKWFKPSREPMKLATEVQTLVTSDKEKESLRHNFQQLTVLRFARCDHCGDKMWGTQLRCNVCNLGCHTRCVGQISLVCVSESRPRDDGINMSPLPPSMFGRDLIEQVRADSAKEHRDIPVIVEKCISAVELLAMDYEGIYRKSGGSSQSKAITQLFERGNYDAFDLRNPDSFNDISSVTSVLKTYFRQLPNPLLTNALHEAFVGAAIIREPRGKAESLSSLIYQLPSEHFHTLRYLMLHLYRVQLRSSENFMNARNLGVVFGPTLMRSSDPSREFADMAGKALAIEWLIENAPTVFREEE